MANIETVIDALPNILIDSTESIEDSETIQRSRTSGRSSTALEKVILKPHCIFCNKEGQKKTKEKGVRTTEATAVFECEGW